MMNTILFALWFYLPAGNANMAPVFAKKIKYLNSLNIPLDFGLTFREKRIFGENKTLRGLIAGYFAAWVALALQVWVYNHIGFINNLSFIDYNEINIWLFSLIFSIGALGGDALESFFKRQMGIKPGQSWAPYDQIDWILGAVALSLLVTNFSINLYLWAIAWGLILHPLSTVTGWLLKLKDSPI